MPGRGRSGTGGRVLTVRLPLPGIRHRCPRLLGRQRVALLQEFDRVLVGRAHEGHVAVARRPVDGDAGFVQPVAQRIDVVDLIGEMAEIASLAIVLAVPIIGQLDERRLAGGRAVGDQAAVPRCRQEDQRIFVLLVDPPAHFREAQLVAIKIERGIEIAHAQHCMQIPHGQKPPLFGQERKSPRIRRGGDQDSRRDNP